MKKVIVYRFFYCFILCYEMKMVMAFCRIAAD